ncbi:MAG: disulfide bond formation protein B [Endozoicomonadaceae bacterium]|nr:disulfide bond formation protein B [Endozoicomonadaceae bacterium]
MRLAKSYTIYWVLLLLSIALLGIALLFEHIKGLIPCPLCISQRFIFGIIGFLSFIVILFRPGGTKLRAFGLLVFIFSLLGLALAYRQIYLEHLPASASRVCLPGLEYLIQIMPWQEILKTMFVGSPECGVVHWTFLGFSMAVWLVPVFVFIAVIGLIEIVRKHDIIE